MDIKTARITYKTSSNTDVIDITDDVSAFVGKSKIENGLVTIVVPGSTASITTIEYENGAVRDLIRAIEELVPKDRKYAHDSRWGDMNGYAHVRAALLKASLSIPIIESRLALGTWQQIVLVDFDNRPRTREVVFQVMG